MSFKDEYNELQNNIAPDAEFLERLEQKMELQMQEQRKPKKSKRPLMIFISAATVCAGAAAALTVIFNRPTPAPPVHMAIKTDQNKISYTVGVFAESAVLSNDEKIPEQLADMLADENTVVYKSDKNKFEFEDKISDEQREALSERIRSAAATNSQPDQTAEYYMVVSENGDIVKFRIAGDILEAGEKYFKLR